MFIVLLHLLATTVHASSTSLEDEGLKICTDVGNYIYSNAHGDTQQPYVYYNSTDHSVRIKTLKLRYQLGGYDSATALDFYLSKWIDKTPPVESKEKIRKTVYEDTHGLTKPYISQTIIKIGSVFAPALTETLRMAEPIFKEKLSGAVGSQLVSSLWIKLFADARYVKPILQLAKELHFRVLYEEPSEKTLQEDLIQAFVDSNQNISKEEAIEMAWTVLGLYGSQGAYMSSFSGHYDLRFKNTGLGFALGYLAELISVMDTLHSKNGNLLYSLPKTFSTRCAIGKPYHFWMSAYFAHELSKKFSFKKSAKAPFIMAEAYEYYMQTNGRNIDEYSRDWTLIQMKLDDVTLQSIRISHVLHAAGAAFGASELKNKEYRLKNRNLDAALGYGFQQSKEPFFRKLAVKTERSTIPTRHLNLKRMTASDEIYDYIVK